MTSFRPARDIQHPHAYANAVQARIKQNANKTRRAALVAAVANDSLDFRIWLGLEQLPNPHRAESKATWALVRSTEAAWVAIARTSKSRIESGMRQWTPEELEVWQAWQDARAANEKASDAFARAEQAAEKVWRKQVGYVPEFIRIAMDEWGGLTDGQLAYARKAFYAANERHAQFAKQDEDRKANAPKWTLGRHKNLTGKILSVRVQDGEYGITVKGMVKLDDGRMIWMSLPGFIESDKGSAVAIGAITVEKISDTDATMAFGHRPYKVTTPEKV